MAISWMPSDVPRRDPIGEEEHGAKHEIVSAHTVKSTKRLPVACPNGVTSRTATPYAAFAG